jgi:hypothetical protein
VENNEVKNFINLSKDYVVCQITQQTVTWTIGVKCPGVIL